MVSESITARYLRLREIGCICCRISGVPTGMRVEVDHLVHGGYRKHSGGNAATIPLCEWHHRGVPVRVGLGKIACAATYGPSWAEGSKAFVRHWGSKLSLLAKVNELLERA
jgi:hypothetical protein